jgi:hypothetical protein
MRCCFLLPFPLKSTARTTTSRAHTNRSCSSASGWSYDPPPHKSVDWSFTIFGFLRETRARCHCPAPRPRRRFPRCRRRTSRRTFLLNTTPAAASTDANDATQPTHPPLRRSVVFTPTLLTTPPALRHSSRRTSRRSQSTLPTTLLLTTLAQSTLPTTLLLTTLDADSLPFDTTRLCALPMPLPTSLLAILICFARFFFLRHSHDAPHDAHLRRSPQRALPTRPRLFSRHSPPSPTFPADSPSPCRFSLPTCPIDAACRRSLPTPRVFLHGRMTCARCPDAKRRRSEVPAPVALGSRRALCTR